MVCIDIGYAPEQAGIQANEVNMLKAIKEVKTYLSEALTSYGDEILEVMMANLFKQE